MAVNFNKVTLRSMEGIMRRVMPKARWQGPIRTVLNNVIEPIALSRVQVAAEIKEKALVLQGQLTMALFDLPAKKPAAAAQAAEEAKTTVRSAAHIIAGGIEKGEIDLANAGIFGITDKAGRRANEDGIAYIEVDGKRIMLIADGMGGHKKGEKASELALATMTSHLKKDSSDLRGALRAADAAVKTLAGKDDKNPPGTTIAVIIIDGDKVITTHLGDSLIILQKADNSFELKTYPHSGAVAFALLDFKDEIMIEDGNPAVQQKFLALGERFIESLFRYKHAPDANRISKSLGPKMKENGLVSEELKDEDIVIKEFTLGHRERLIAFSDGLEALDWAEIRQILTCNNEKPVKEIAGALIDAAKQAIADSKKDPEKRVTKDNISIFIYEPTVALEDAEIIKEPEETKAFPKAAIEDAARIVDTKARIAELEAGLAAARQEASANAIAAEFAQGELQKLQQTVSRPDSHPRAAELQLTIADLSRNREAMSGQISGLTSEIRSLRTELEIRKRTITSLESAIKEKEAAYNERARMAEQRLQDFRAKMLPDMEELEGLRAKNDRTTEENIMLGTLERSIEVRTRRAIEERNLEKQKIEEEKNNSSMIIGLKDDIRDLEAEKGVLEEQIGMLARQGKALTEQLGGLDEQLVQIGRRIEDDIDKSKKMLNRILKSLGLNEIPKEKPGEKA